MIVVFGSINADLVARVAHLPLEGETQRASGYAVHAGGKGANQALAARRAGAEATMVGAVGRDGFADTALATLREAGVDTSLVARLDVATGLALIHVDDRGSNAITVVPGANGRVSAAMLEACPLDASSVVLLQLEVPLAEVADAAHRARSRGARVVLNVAPPDSLPGHLLDAVDVLVANEHEAAVVADATGLPRDPAAFCAAAADRWRLLAVVTLGAAGVVAADAAHAWRVDAARVAVVDTTAAGDGFVGAFAAALERGVPIVEALAEGAAAGSYACTTPGAQASLAPRARWVAAAQALAARASTTPR